MSSLDQLPKGNSSKPNVNHHDKVKDQDLADYINSLDPLDTLDDLDNWSDDINLFMQGLADPARFDELWLKVKAKETWEKFQWNLPEITSPGDNLENPRPSEKDLKIWNDLALRLEMGLPPPEPTYHPWGLKNSATVIQKIYKSQILTGSERDLDSLL